MADLSSGEAAALLGVSSRQVRRLVADGVLPGGQVAGRWTVDRHAVECRLVRRPGRGRPLAPRIAWAVLHELAGCSTSWVSASERSRLRSWLRRAVAAERVALACRGRAELRSFRCLPRYLTELGSTSGVAAGGLSAAAVVGVDVLGDDTVELYCSAQTAGELVERFGLLPSRRANVVLRVPPPVPDVLLGRAVMPSPVVAVDLLEAADVRSRRAGRDALEAALCNFRRC